MLIAIGLQIWELKSREFGKPGAKGRSGFQFSVAVFGLWSQPGSKLMQFSAMQYTVSTLKGALAGG
jgi:hypothetical protein